MATTSKLVELFNALADASLTEATATAFVEAAYENLLGLSGDFSNKDARVAYWVAQIEGGVSRADFASTFLAAAAVQGDLLTDAEFAVNGVVLTALEALDETDLTLESVKAAAVAAAEEAAEEEEEEANAGETFTLTTDTDSIIGTAKDDTITGTTATLSADDRILDSSLTDNDTLNLTLTADPVAMDVSNIENINIDWDAFGTADVDLDNVTGATVTISSDKSGYLGGANFTNVGDNSITTSAGVVGTVAIGAIEDATVIANNAATLTVGGAGGAGTSTEAADGDLTVTAAVATSITVDGADNLILNAAAATSVTLDVSDTATLNFGTDATLDLTGADNAGGEFTLAAEEAVEVTLADGSDFDLLTVGDNVELSVADDDILDAEEVVGATVINTDVEFGGATDLEKVEHTSINVGAAQDTSVALTVASGAVFDFEAGGNGTVTIQTSTSEDSAADVAKVTVRDDLSGLTVSTADQDIETLTIVAANANEVTGTDLTIAAIEAAAEKVVLESASNDVKLTSVLAGEVDASAAVGDLVINQKTGSTTADMVIVGSQGDNEVAFTATSGDSQFVGGEGDDSVTFATTSGEAAAVVGNGKNTVTFSAAVTGSASVVAGSGNDTVTADSLTTGELSAQLGDGDNTVSAAAVTTGTVVVTGGAGDDSVTVDGDLAGATISVTNTTGDATVTIDDATTADEKVTLNLGEGTDTLAISEDITAGTFTVSGLDVIAIGANAGAAKVNATLLDGQSYLITAQGTATETLLVEADKAGDFDFSSIAISNVVGKALAGLNVSFTAAGAVDSSIIGTAGNDTISFANATANNSATGGAGADSVTLVASTGTDVLTFGIGDLVAATASDESAGADDGAITDADTITFGNGVDLVTNFTTGTDKIDLSAFGLTAGSLDASAADDSITIGNGKYAILQGNFTAGTGVFAAAAAGTDTVVIFDADTSASVSLVGIVLDEEIAVAADLILA